MIGRDVTAERPTLGPLTTLGVGGAARSIVEVRTRQELVAAVSSAEAPSDPDALFVLGGGSNVIISDDGHPGEVVLVRGGPIERTDQGDGTVRFDVEAGAGWDDLVVASVEAGCRGIELMSGVPGTVGAAPIQNIGAYGQQVGDVIERVDVLDRHTLAEGSFTAEECGFAFRTSRFKGEWLDRYVIVGVTFVLPSAEAAPPEPSTYVDIAKWFERNPGSPTSVADRRRAVLATRSRKSMLLDATDPNARSVGSFFINPSVPLDLAERLAEQFQTMGLSVQYLEGRGQQDTSRRRVPAAHVLRSAGFNAGDSWGPVGLSQKHVLAMVTRPGATATDVWNVSHHVRARVEEATGVRLSCEPKFIGTFPAFDPAAFATDYTYEPAPAVEPEWLTSYR